MIAKVLVQNFKLKMKSFVFSFSTFFNWLDFGGERRQFYFFFNFFIFNQLWLNYCRVEINEFQMIWVFSVGRAFILFVGCQKYKSSWICNTYFTPWKDVTIVIFKNKYFHLISKSLSVLSFDSIRKGLGQEHSWQ